MGVVPLSDNPADALPWWARQGGGGPTGGPAAAPQGAGGQAWLQYLQQMFGLGGDPANMPSANASNKAMVDLGNPDPNVTGPGPGNVGPVDVSDHGTGDNPPVPASVAPRPFAIPPGAPAQPSFNPLAGGSANTGLPVAAPGPLAAPGYAGSSGAGSGDPRTADAAMNQMTGMAPGVVNPGYAPPGIAPGRANPNVPAADAQPVKGPLATGGATGAGATSNPRFVNVSHDVSGGGRTPYISALNLASLFGGQPAVNPNAPAANAQPVSAVPGPLAKNGTLNLPANYNLGRSGYYMTPSGDVGGSSANAGPPTMTPDQLRRAVHKPNWYRNV